MTFFFAQLGYYTPWDPFCLSRPLGLLCLSGLSGLSGLFSPSEIGFAFHGINLFGQFSLFGYLSLLGSSSLLGLLGLFGFSSLFRTLGASGKPKVVKKYLKSFQGAKDILLPTYQ